ncbi:carbohydrate sulfotransferase 11-like [Mercenaria mercenaria]|uniref:carbohydrate sulfotransferase 11-like n=1 Tax=Mercenaria mercenaria TaxID=6596 RepID=UPI001E1E07C6|nr:carbohydrate sulfotransferase 11-like [Mercenaria mercenaria]
MFRRRFSRWSRFLGIVGLCTVAFGSLYVKNNDDTTILNGSDPFLVVKEFSESKDPPPPPSEEEKALEEEMKIRNMRVEKICREMKEQNITLPNAKAFENEYLKHLMVIEKTKSVWCYLPKVASTNFRRTILGMMGVIPKSEVPTIGGYEVYNIHDKEFKYIRDYDEEKQKEIMSTYKKFFATRDPIERLLSGYMSKFLHPNPVNRHEFNKRVSLFYGSHPELDQLHKMKIDYEGRSVFFEEFLVWWSDLYDENLYVNEHFVPTHVLCNPCEVNYDYIGKYEHINRDMDYIFKKLDIDAEFPGRNDNYSARRTHTMVEEVYKPLPGWIMQKIWNVMKYDWIMFGYPIPDWLKQNVHSGDLPEEN